MTDTTTTTVLHLNNLTTTVSSDTQKKIEALIKKDKDASSARKRKKPMKKKPVETRSFVIKVYEAVADPKNPLAPKLVESNMAEYEKYQGKPKKRAKKAATKKK